MCKIAFIPVVTKETLALSRKIVKALSKEMCHSDPHGLGYIEGGLNSDGVPQMRVERWLKPKDIFKKPKPNPLGSWLTETFGDALDCPGSVAGNEEGVDPDSVMCILAHARYATTPICLENVHPFVISTGNAASVVTTALVHNGIVHGWPQAKAKLPVGVPDCDSYLLAHKYAENELVFGDAGSVEGALYDVTGSYAVAAMSTYTSVDGNGLVLDYFRNSGSQMNAAYVDAIKGLVFCTSAQLLTSILTKLKLKHTMVETTAYRRIVWTYLSNGEHAVVVEDISELYETYAYRGNSLSQVGAYEPMVGGKYARSS